MSTNYLLEYIWIDAYDCPRSKTKVILLNRSSMLTIEDLPDWTYDGSSTGQAEGHDSDVILKPCALFNDPFRQSTALRECYLVLCETYNKDLTPHETNYRSNCKKIVSELDLTVDAWFGIEQEYIIYDKETGFPYQWKNWVNPGCGPQGPYYCSCGGDRTFGRSIVEKHLDLCLQAGLMICGINAEVMPSQWEFQIGPLNALEVSDQLWVARYILNRVTEEYGCWINYHPKPCKEWNGSGCHTNFSTLAMRQENGYCHIIEACNKLANRHQQHLEVYGEHNELRLTGHHETSNMKNFNYAEGHRGCSVRIPLGVVNDQKGYLEDRRPASNMDPYRVTSKILSTVCLDQ